MPADGNGHPPGALCTCGLVGRYTGCQPIGGLLVRVAFDCLCGAVWGFDVLKDEVEKYRG